MKRKMLMIPVFILVLLLAVTFSGCATPGVTWEDIGTVNKYLSEKGIKALSYDDADTLHRMAIYENKNTGEKKRYWQMVVDYVRNEENGRPLELGYTIVFDNNGMDMTNNTDWENIGA